MKLRFWQISETAKAILWLWENDSKNWVLGGHAVVHQQTGVAVWTANDCYGLSLYYDIPDHDRVRAHPCAGRQVKLRRPDRRALYRIIVQGISLTAHQTIQRQIADWATDKIENHIGGRVSV